MTPLELVLSRLHGVKRTSNGYDAQCPAHDDRHNHLCIAEGADGRVLLDCKVGCPTDVVVAKMGLDMRDLFPPRPADPGSNTKRTAGGGVYTPANNGATVQQSPTVRGCALAAYAEAK